MAKLCKTEALAIRICAAGNVGRCETRSMLKAGQVTNFPVASNKKYKGADVIGCVNRVAFG